MCEDGGQKKRKGADGEEREAGGWGPPFHGGMLAGDAEGGKGIEEKNEVGRVVGSWGDGSGKIGECQDFPVVANMGHAEARTGDMGRGYGRMGGGDGEG